jgi:hypothetical protein
MRHLHTQAHGGGKQGQQEVAEAMFNSGVAHLHLEIHFVTD